MQQNEQGNCLFCAPSWSCKYSTKKKRRRRRQKDARSTTDCSVQVPFHHISRHYRGLLHLHHANLGATTQPTGHRTRTSSTKSQLYFNTFFMKLTSWNTFPNGHSFRVRGLKEKKKKPRILATLKHLCRNSRAIFTEITHCPLSNLARRRSSGARKGRDANFPGGVCWHCTGRLRDRGQVEWPGGRQQQVRAAGSRGLASLAGSRGGSGRGPKPGNATALPLLRRPHAL